jgi:hypothetical protein
MQFYVCFALVVLIVQCWTGLAQCYSSSECGYYGVCCRYGSSTSTYGYCYSSTQSCYYGEIDNKCFYDSQCLSGACPTSGYNSYKVACGCTNSDQCGSNQVCCRSSSQYDSNGFCTEKYSSCPYGTTDDKCFYNSQCYDPLSYTSSANCIGSTSGSKGKCFCDSSSDCSSGQVCCRTSSSYNSRGICRQSSSYCYYGITDGKCLFSSQCSSGYCTDFDYYSRGTCRNYDYNPYYPYYPSNSQSSSSEISLGLITPFAVFGVNLVLYSQKSFKQINEEFLQLVFIGCSALSYAKGSLQFLYVFAGTIIGLFLLYKIILILTTICTISVTDSCMHLKFSYCWWNSKAVIPLDKIVYVQTQSNFLLNALCFLCGGSYQIFIIGLDVFKRRSQVVMCIRNSLAEKTLAQLHEKIVRKEATHELD